MKKNNYSGRFIVIEGLDGSGQSTQTELLKEFLTQNGFKVLTTKEPTLDSLAGKKIREVLDKNTQVAPVYLQELFAEDRGEHLENLVIPALKDGKVVISDRYFFSTFAYGASDGLDLEWLISINNEFLLPDVTFLLKVSPRICLSRIEKRGIPQTLFEKEQKLARVWETYEILPKRFQNVYMINGEKPREEVFAQIKDLLHYKWQI